MGAVESVSGLREHIVGVLRHKDERYISFVHCKDPCDQYLKFWTYSNAMVDDKKYYCLTALRMGWLDIPGLVMFGSGKWI